MSVHSCLPGFRRVAVKVGSVIYPATALVALAGFAPTVANNESVAAAPGVGGLTVTGLAPTWSTATASTNVNTGTGVASFAGQSPTITTPAATLPLWNGTGTVRQISGFGVLVATGKAPTVQVTGNVAASPGVGTLTVTGLAPTWSSASAGWTSIGEFEQDGPDWNIPPESITLGFAVQVNDVITVAGSQHYNDSTATMTDSLGNTYTKIDSVYDATTRQRLETFFCRVTTAGTPTVSYNFAAVGLSYVTFKGHVFRGGTSSASVNKHADVVRATPGTGANAITSGSVTTTTPCLCWGVVMNVVGASFLNGVASGTGWTDIGATAFATGKTLHDEYLTQGGAGAVNATFTDSTNGATYTYMVAILAISP